MFNIIKPGTNFDFVGRRWLWIGISVVGLIASFVLMGTKGLNYGIDFTGGAEIHLRVPLQWDIGKVREVLSQGGLPDVRVQSVGAQEGNKHSEFLVRAQGEENQLNQIADQVRGALSKNLKPEEFDLLRADIVGPAAGSTLRKNGFLAMFFALLVILVYVSIRFDARYAPGAVIALFHDSVIVLGIFVITQKQFDLTILAAVLALIGYSNNDTIIVYDRVRETLHLQPQLTVEKAVNLAINETLGRTINTSLATFFVTLSLWLLGGSVLENFAFALTVGIVVGSYSSIFVASALVVIITKYRQDRENRQKMSGKKRQKKVYNVQSEPRFQ